MNTNHALPDANTRVATRANSAANTPLRSVFSRRSFFKTLAAAGAGAVFAPSILSARNPNSKLQIAVIGVGGRGGENIRELVAETKGSEKFFAFCDVNANTLRAQAKRYKVEHLFADYRELLEKQAGALDAVLVATLDHTHGIIACEAMKRGLHCYCEKPLARSVWENRQLALYARQNKKLCTQTGTQVRSWGSAHYYRGIEMLRSGAIGAPDDIEEVHVWCRGSYVPRKDPDGSAPVPAGLNYDLWLGPTPFRPFHPLWLSYSKYGFWHSGCGWITGMGPHTIDLAWTALNLAPPTQIEVDGPPPHPLYNRDNQHVVFTHPRPNGKTLKLHWYDGNRRPQGIAPERIDARADAGVLFVGKDGNLQIHYGYNKLLPAKKFAGQAVAPRLYAPSVGHHKQWLDAIKAGKPSQCECGFEYAAPYTEAITLAAQMHATGTKRLAWDAAALKTDSPLVNARLKPEFRDNWKFPEIAG
ncbi:MAG: Gfo/Idh/MocA family oxidoreductase [Puniceicoccales bacterium]|jgi:predicted dehydrogenase|nr:Gfo/Idh/MocA family oxidoreductase [Puniceicoccales bacterium]